MCHGILLILQSQSTGSDAIKFEYHGFGTRYRDPAKDFPLLRGFAIFIALSKAQTIIQGNILVVWKNPLSGLHKAGCESIGSAEVGSRKRDLHREQTNRNR